MVQSSFSIKRDRRLFEPVLQVLYKKGDPSETFYIIKEGKVSVETSVDIQKENKWPVGTKEWKIKKTIRTVLYKITLEVGSWFGEIEIIRRVNRLNKVIALSDCYILYLNANKFQESTAQIII